MNNRPTFALLCLLSLAVVVVLVLSVIVDQRPPDRSQGTVAPDADRAVATSKAPDVQLNSVAVESDGVRGEPNDAVVTNTDELQSVDASLRSRYPLIAQRLVVDGVPLSEVDLSQLPEQKFFEYIHQVQLLAAAVEEDVLATLHGVEALAVDRDAARAKYELNPSSYFAKIPGVAQAGGRGHARYVDLTSALPRELFEARMLSVELSGHQRLQEYQVNEYQTLANTPRSDGGPGMERLPVATWKSERFGQILVGYDASGRMVAQIRGNWVGVPDY